MCFTSFRKKKCVDRGNQQRLSVFKQKKKKTKKQSRRRAEKEVTENSFLLSGVGNSILKEDPFLEFLLCQRIGKTKTAQRYRMISHQFHFSAAQGETLVTVEID